MSEKGKEIYLQRAYDDKKRYISELAAENLQNGGMRLIQSFKKKQQLKALGVYIHRNLRLDP